jgi:hypothetical protein
MKLIKVFLFLIATVLLTTSCGQNDFRNTYTPSEKQKIANEIRQTVAQEIKEKLGLYPCGTGGRMMDEIKMLALAFDCYHPITIEEGRDLLISSVDTFIEAINADERIRPYLANYPFEPRNVQIRIFLRSPKGSNLSSGELAVISAINGLFKYKIDDPKGPLFVTTHEETYQDALQAQKTSDSSLLKLAQ